MKKAVMLLSGGLDSAVTLYLARKLGFKCLCLTFDYGQRHRREIHAAKKIAGSAHCPLQTVKIILPWKGSALLDKNIAIPKRTNSTTAGRANSVPSTYVPARNIVFMSFALSCAEALRAEAIFIGAHIQDYSGYPDCRPQFYRAFTKVIACGTWAGTSGKRIRIFTPLIHKGKAEIIKLGQSLKVPFGYTWSCYSGGEHPCGGCDSCYFRARGFQQAGIKDPLLKER